MLIPLKPTFEESYDLVLNEVNKRKPKWNLTSIAWMDFQDVSQIILNHIFIKWHLFKPEKGPLLNWVNVIITNQIRNILRNTYYIHARPCLGCPKAEGENGCTEFGTQSNECGLYADWEKNKKEIYYSKMPISIEKIPNEIGELKGETLNVEKSILNVHARMREILKPIEWKVYEHLYINHGDEKKIPGFKHNDRKKAPNSKTLSAIKTDIVAKTKECFKKQEIDFIH